MENKELTIQERAAQYLMETIHDDNHAIKNAYIAGAADQQAEFIKLIEGEIAEYKKDENCLDDFYYAIQALTNLLTKAQKL